MIEKLFVRVDIAHPSRGDLRIELAGPDGTSVVLQLISVDRARDIHVTYGIDATPAMPLDVFRGKSAAGTWTLRVIDQILQDAGTLQELGWTEGRNLRIDIRWGAGNLDRVRKYVTELLAPNPDVVLATGASSVGPMMAGIDMIHVSRT